MSRSQNVNMSFELTNEQSLKLAAWVGHCTTYAGAIGGRLRYEFTPTGIGTIVNVQCLCGERLELTESGNW